MSRRALVLALALALVTAACTSAEQRASSTTLVLDRGFELVEPEPDSTLIEPSDDVRIGRLDNGLTYYVRSNAFPGSALSLRLAVNAGSLQQEVSDSGAAHFLEHMLFNGTERYPGNELDRALQRIGVQIGPDLNAYTGFEETVYQLELSTTDDENVEIGFSVLAEWASAATIEQQATIEERGVVREEIRLSDEGSAGVISAVFDEAYFAGTPYRDRDPGGSDEQVLATDAGGLKRFYDRWYRPDLMAIIAVGDLPVDRLEAEIRDRFSDLGPRGDEAEQSDVVVSRSNQAITRVVVHPDQVGTFGSLDYPMTSWDRPTIGGERLSLIQDLFAAMIQNRLDDAVDLGRIELIDPFATMFSENRAQTFFGFAFDGDDLAAASEFVLAEVRRAELGGFNQDEYERVAAEFEAELDQFLAASRGANDRDFADDYVAHFLQGSPIDSADAAHERLVDALRSIDADEVTELFRWELSRTAPILVVGGPDPLVLPSEALLDEAIVVAAKPKPISDKAPSGAAIVELMDRPDPTEPQRGSELAEIGATEWTFANGVTVRFLPSSITPDQIMIEAVGQGGSSVLSDDEARLAPLAVAAVAGSGLGGHDRLSLRRFLAGRNALIAPFISEVEEGFFGTASADDLEVLFQQLHLLVTAPRVDGPALREAIDQGERLTRLVETDVAIAAEAAIADNLYPGAERFSVAPPPLDSLTADRALDIYRQRFGTVDDLLVAVVGDADKADVAFLAAHYLGTLPSGPATSWADVRPEALARIARSEIMVGSGETTGAVAVLYPSVLDLDATTRVQLKLLEGILTTRIFEQVREELAASYGGYVSFQVNAAPVEGVDSLFYANVDPDRAEEVATVLVEAARDLAASGPTDDEFERAYSVLAADFELTSNIELIDLLLTSPDEDVLTYEHRIELLGAVEPADLQALAVKLFPEDVRVEVVVVPG